MGKVIGKEREVCFMDLAYKDYNNHVRPIQEEIKKTEQVIVDLHKQFEETDSSTQRKRISEVLRELNTALPKMRLEQSKMSSKYSVDITLFQLARELDELEKHNATVTSYMEVEQIIIEKLQPIVNKLKEAYSDESALPLLAYKIGGLLKESRRLQLKDKKELEQKFYDRCKLIESNKDEENVIDDKYKTMLDEILKKYI